LIALKETIYQKEYGTLVLDADIPAIYEDWNGAVSEAEFKNFLEQKLALFVAHKKQIPNLNWMVNLKGLRVGEKAQAWANKDFHPLLHKQGIKKIAFIVPENMLYMLDNEQLTPHMDSCNQVELCYFDNMEDAKEWLKKMPLAEGL